MFVFVAIILQNDVEDMLFQRIEIIKGNIDKKDALYLYKMQERTSN